ncbi:hypothetical protein Salat_1371600 [Sesamum alatum]|uniref:Uncharacterized protein n=1 Tax=Sesamum alatum TaxID=300844 RepID=A0AAE1YA63_9LAMI|nr:hypothetical protein Salat_1371600 [Sesamum alatum]
MVLGQEKKEVWWKEGSNLEPHLGSNIRPNSSIPPYSRMKNMEALLDEAAKRGAQADLLLMKENEEASRPTKMEEDSPLPKERVDHLGSSKASTRTLIALPEDPRINIQIKDIEELCK